MLYSRKLFLLSEVPAMKAATILIHAGVFLGLSLGAVATIILT